MGWPLSVVKRQVAHRSSPDTSWRLTPHFSATFSSSEMMVGSSLRDGHDIKHLVPAGERSDCLGAVAHPQAQEVRAHLLGPDFPLPFEVFDSDEELFVSFLEGLVHSEEVVQRHVDDVARVGVDQGEDVDVVALPRLALVRVDAEHGSAAGGDSGHDPRRTIRAHHPVTFLDLLDGGVAARLP